MNTTPGTNGGIHVVNQPLTTSATKEVAPSLLRNAIDERIVRINPMSTPVDQISRFIGSRHCPAMTVEYYSVDNKATETTVTRDLEASNEATGDDGTTMKSIEVKDSRCFSPSDTILFPAIDIKGSGPLAGYVKAVRDQMIDVVGLNIPIADGTAKWPAISEGVKIVRMGRAAAELDVQTPQFQAIPRKQSNFCQIFKMQVEQSTLQKMASKEVDWNFSDQEEAAIRDMRAGMEKNFLFGAKGRILADNGREHIYLTGGIWNQTDKEYQLSIQNISERDLIDFCSKVFTGNNGSKKRVLLAGTDLALALNKVQYTRSLSGDNNFTRWGLRFREIESNFGTLFVMHSEMFDACGHRKDGFVLDPDYITKYTHIPFSKECLDLRRAGDRNTDAVVLTEASCMVLRHPDAHCRVIGK